MNYKTYGENLSKNRLYLMGFSMLLVLIYHSGFEPKNFIIATICWNGHIGVDIFLVISGFSMYYSLLKDNNIKRFYQKRFIKIIPPYIICLICFLFLAFKNSETLITFKTIIISFILNIIPLAHINDYPYSFNWYISAIIYFYLLAPFIYYLINKKTYYIIIPIIITIIIYPFTFYTNANIIVIRFLDFLMGMYIAHMSLTNKDKKISPILIIIISILALAFRIYAGINNLDPYFGYGLEKISFVIAMPGIIYILFTIFSFIKDNNIFKKIFKILGLYTYEIYLLNVTFMPRLLSYIFTYIPFNNTETYIRIFTIIINILLGITFGKILNKIFKY